MVIFKTTNCWAKKGNQRIKRKHTENVLDKKVARVEENSAQIESRVQKMYDYELD